MSRCRYEEPKNEYGRNYQYFSVLTPLPIKPVTVKEKPMKPGHIDMKARGDYVWLRDRTERIGQTHVILTFESEAEAEQYENYMHAKGFKRFKKWLRKTRSGQYDPADSRGHTFY